MMFKDAKVGDQIVCYTQDDVENHISAYNTQPNGGSTLLAWIVEHDTPTGTILGWKSGEPCPINNNSCFETPLTQDYKDMGMVVVFRYGSHCECEPYTAGGIAPPKKAVDQQASGCKCTRCLEWYEYAVPVEKFVCYGCRH